MRTTQSLSITLPIEMAEMVKSKVSSGEYATESEVIRDGLRTLIARDAAIEKWLVEEVVPAYDEVMAHPEKLLSGEQVSARLDARMAGLLKRSGSA
ncbi:type II toxin-antitoxin system ParD family antitoxin [Neorhizobium lilium]|uniref:Type II toxin-antitoxin system ParD family antitoxin n=1 Tax=Neorhizobium lilium TaxID=2503024 RepID=A0A444LGI9_9HYPH|nr:type II toxin-antitoxin system ParD family antitoxin [Neorhizobium lilium]RWX77297.1 type II toxin-antitoxin system ParD family antitoxin [Neorhizobium lilium]